MKKVMFLATGALLFAGFSVAQTMSNELIIGANVQVGNTQVAPGTYYVREKGDCAIFTNVRTGRTFRVTANKAVPLDQKIQTPLVLVRHNQIERLGLGGYATELQFTAPSPS
jgi:hypothetical protein